MYHVRFHHDDSSAVVAYLPLRLGKVEQENEDHFYVAEGNESVDFDCVHWT